jgi:hypothetical protein
MLLARRASEGVRGPLLARRANTGLCSLTWSPRVPVPCPCCKALNDAGPTCRRCKADLSLLFAVEGQRAAAVADAGHLASDGRFPEALAALDRAAQLRHTPDLPRLRAAVLLLARDFPAALRAYHGLANPQ